MNTPTHEGASGTAEVVAYRCRVRYHRWGSGPSVILLRPSELAGPVDAALVEGLAARFRVLVPMIDGMEVVDLAAGDADEASAHAPADSATLADGLRCFVEGLGLLDGGMVAAGSYRAAAVALASALPDQIARVVLLGDTPGVGGREAAPPEAREEGDALGRKVDPAAPSNGAGEGWAWDTSGALSVPLLEIACDQTRVAWDLSRITRFLGGE